MLSRHSLDPFFFWCTLSYCTCLELLEPQELASPPIPIPRNEAPLETILEKNRIYPKPSVVVQATGPRWPIQSPVTTVNHCPMEIPESM